MRRLVRMLHVVASLATLLAAGAASAVVLPVHAELTLVIGTGASAPRITVTTTGSATANGAGGTGPLTQISLPAGLLAAIGSHVDVTDVAAAPIEGLIATLGNGAASFGVGGGTLGGSMPLPGVLRLCLFANCDAIPPANMIVPLTPIGNGGSQFGEASVNLTVLGSPWTTGTVMGGVRPSTETWTGSRQGPASAPSSTARIGGTIQLVTPFQIATTLSPIPTPGFAFLRLHFVPEPGTALLLGAGVVLLTCFGAKTLR